MIPFLQCLLVTAEDAETPKAVTDLSKEDVMGFWGQPAWAGRMGVNPEDVLKAHSHIASQAQH